MFLFSGFLGFRKFRWWLEIEEENVSAVRVLAGM